MTLAGKEAVEIDYWKNSEHEKPDSNSIYNLVLKAVEARVLLTKLETYGNVFSTAGTIVELGAGQAWGSCVVKYLFPNAHVTATDISPHAIASRHKWERVYDVDLDAAITCRSYEIPYEDESTDIVFCFSSAHHFVDHRGTLREIMRILKPGGHAYYFHEPACRGYIHAIAKRRVNAKRPAVPEDLILYKEIELISSEIGLSCTPVFSPTTIERSDLETLYYFTLRQLPFLQRLLPCSIDFTFRKNAT